MNYTTKPSSQIKSLFKKRFTLWFGGAMALLLLLSAILRALTPKESAVPNNPKLTRTNINQTQSEYSNIEYVGRSPDLPDGLAVSQFKEISNEDRVVQTIIDNLRLVKSDKSDRYWENKQGQYLHQDPYSRKYQLSFNLKQVSQTEVDPLYQPKQLLEVAQKEIVSLFPQLKLSSQPTKIDFFKAGVEFYQKSTQNNYDFAHIPFSYTIDGFPVFYGQETASPFVVRISSSGKILSVNFAPLFITWQTISQNKSLTVGQALENINQNNMASIISYGLQSEAVEVKLSEIQSANLETVSVEYRQDKDSQILYPFYHFVGQAKDAANQQIKIDLITPAVKVGNN